MFLSFAGCRVPPLVAQECVHVSGPNKGRPMWSFVGSVPADLAYECSANDPETRAYLFRAAAHSGPSIARGIAQNRGYTFGARYFPSEEAALAAAAAIGARVTQVCPLDTTKWRTLPLPEAEQPAPPARRRRTRRAAA